MPSQLEPSQRIKALYAFFDIDLDSSRINSYLTARSTGRFGAKGTVLFFRASREAQLPVLRPPADLSAAYFDAADPAARAAACAQALEMSEAACRLFCVTNGTENSAENGLREVSRSRLEEEAGLPVSFERYFFGMRGEAVVWAIVLPFEGQAGLFCLPGA